MKNAFPVSYAFDALLWRSDGPGGWHFVSLPPEMSSEIRLHFQSEEQGWGRLSAEVTLGSIAWESALWFDTKRNTYLLPIKTEIRREARLTADATLSVVVRI
jgi:hypothetical protein